MEPSRDLLGKTMSCRHLDDFVIVTHEQNLLPDEGEWERYVEWCASLLAKYPALKVLVLAGDKAPTASQRSFYNREIPGERVRIAVLMTNRTVLMIVKIFAWFVGNIKAFDSGDVAAACAYLGVPLSEEIQTALVELRQSAAAKSAAR